MGRELCRYLGEGRGRCELLIAHRDVGVVSLEILQDGLHVLGVDAPVYLQRYPLRWRRGGVVEVVVAASGYHDDRNDDRGHLRRSPDRPSSHWSTATLKWPNNFV